MSASLFSKSGASAPSGRLRALRRYGILNTPDEAAFDRITDLAAHLFDVPLAAINFVDDRCQWSKSTVGFRQKTVELEASFCARVLASDDVMVVEDAAADERFARNPLVTGEPGIRFYAGAPLVTPDGYRIGALCIADNSPRAASAIGADDRETLRVLADVVVDALEQRRETRRRRRGEQFARLQARILDQVARGAALAEVLANLIVAVEDMRPAMIGSIQLYDRRNRCIRHGAAPHLPDAYNEAIDGAAVGPRAGSCGTAIHHGKTVVVEDIASDPRWVDYRALALKHDLRACWSTPIRDASGAILGTFAMYYRTPARPSRADRALIDRARSLAQIAMCRHRDLEALSEVRAVAERSQDLLRRTQLIARVGGWEYDPAQDAVWGTEALCAILDLSEGITPTLQATLTLFAPEARPAVRAAITRCLDEGTPFDLEVPLAAQADVQRAVVRLRGTVRRGGDGQDRITGTLQDVTPQKRIQQQLRMLSEALEQANEAVLITEAAPLDEAGPRIEYVNAAFEAMTGYSREEVVGKTPRILQGPDTERAVLQDLRQALEAGEAWHGETVNYRKDGSPYVLQWNVAPVRDETGRIAHWVATQRDVTDQRELEAALREREERFRLLFRDNPLPMWVYDRETLRFLAVNGAAIDRYGYSEDEFLTMRITDIRPAEEVPKLMRDLSRRRDELERSGLWKHQLRDGRVIDVEVVSHCIAYQGREAALVVARDVTARKEMEEQLRAQEQMYRELVQTTSAILWRGDPETFAFTYVSPQAKSLLGYASEAWMEDPDFWIDHVHPEDRAWVLSYCKRATEEQRRHSFDYRMVAADGRTVWLRDIVNVIVEDGKPVELVGVMIDITELKAIEAELHAKEEKVEALYRAMRDLTRAPTPQAVAEEIERVVTDTLRYPIVTVRLAEDGRHVEVAQSEEARRCEAHAPSEAIDGDDLIARLHRSDEVAVYDDVREAAPALGGSMRSVAYVPMGSYGSLWVGHPEVGAIDAFDVQLLEILTRNAASVLERIEREDVLRTARDEAETMNRLKSVLLANMSHEIRTPLTSILGFADLLEDVLEGEERQLLRMIQRSGRRLEETLTSVLDLAALESGSRELDIRPIDVWEAVEEAVQLARPGAREKDLPLRTETPSRCVQVWADPDALTRIVTHLVSNAVKFTDEGHVLVRVVPRDAYVRIEVEDTGIGIAEEFMPHLFDEFKQESEGFKRDYEGTGLGLAITKRLVELMEGHIAVESEKGKGATFTVDLPRCEKGV